VQKDNIWGDTLGRTVDRGSGVLCLELIQRQGRVQSSVSFCLLDFLVVYQCDLSPPSPLKRNNSSDPTAHCPASDNEIMREVSRKSSPHLW
jgi:hypothetical protein